MAKDHGEWQRHDSKCGRTQTFAPNPLIPGFFSSFPWRVSVGGCLTTLPHTACQYGTRGLDQTRFSPYPEGENPDWGYRIKKRGGKSPLASNPRGQQVGMLGVS